MAGMQIAIRKMHANDLDRVTEILARWNMAPLPSSAALPNAEVPAIPIETTFVALVDATIVGVGSYIVIDDEVGQTLVLAVDSEYHHAGIGARLQTARLSEMKTLGILTVRTDADRPEAIAWYMKKFGCRIVGSKPKKHAFGLEGVDAWTVLELDLRAWTPNS